MPVLTKEDHAKIHHNRTIKTISKHKEEWLSNVKLNSDNIKNDVALLWNSGSGGQMISVAAGPSLSEDLEDIRKMRKGRELIVVDAAYKYLVDNGIIPDYVICTDASDKILSMWEGMEKPKGIKLILNVIANPVIVEWWGENIYWFIMANQIKDGDHDNQIIQDLHAVEAKIGGKLFPGGNVSSVALGFCLSVKNADKLYLYGHDFCWKNDFYCGGQLKHLEQERMKMELEAGTVFQEVNTRGEKIWTNLSMKEYAVWHEEAVVRMKYRVINKTKSTILNL